MRGVLLSGLRKDLRAIGGDGALSSVTMGLGETYFPAFVLALSGSQLASGLTSTVPLVLGAVLQLLTPRAIQMLGSYRRWVVLCVLLQAVSFVPLILAGLAGAMPVGLAFAVIAIYWATGLGSGSAWNAWTGTLVPQRICNRYFARRTVLAQGGLLVGIVIGGVTLQAGMLYGWPFHAFALVFGVAIVSRLGSAHYLSHQSEPVPPRGDESPPAWRDAFRALHKSNTGQLLLYLFAMQAAVQISGPYFNPYMLRQLELPYTGYVVLIAASYLAKMAILPHLGHVADRIGSRRLLWVGGLTVIPMSSLWNVSDNFAWLCFVQVLSGIAWGTYELAMLLLFFGAIPRRRRVSVLTLYNLANATATLVGSLIGGALLAWFGSVREAYTLLFFLSSTARIAAVWLLIRAERPAAPSEAVETSPMAEPAGESPIQRQAA